MRSDFVNKRDYGRRRSGGGTTPPQTIQGELIVIPEFDTFFYHKTPVSGTPDDRWGTILDGVGALAKQIPIGLLNPWNDGSDAPSDAVGGVPGVGAVISVRTPTRTAIAYNLSALPINAQILDAKLNLTVAASRDW